MKKGLVLIVIIVVAIICGSAGYLFGMFQSRNENVNSQVQINEFNTAYEKGWSYWFSSYGMNGEGVKYINYYNYGRNYNTEFKDTHDAFIKGYIGGFFYVNKAEPSETVLKRAEKGYQ